MSYNYIAIEGNIGAGKSTLANLLAKHYNATLVLEEFADNVFLPKFYNEPARYALPLELSFLTDRYRQLKQLHSDNNTANKKIIADYTLIKSDLFAQVNLEEQEYALFQNIFGIINPNLPHPDLLIYLDAPILKLQDNIHKRGRAYEQSIPDEYLAKVQSVYQQYLKQTSIKTIIIDTIQEDFITNPTSIKNLLSVLDGQE